MTNQLDPFAKWRTPSRHHDAKTLPDGRSLEIKVHDPAAFHKDVDEIIRLANQHGWRITRLHRELPGCRVREIVIAPRR